uniref:Uncharacterized protein n=1 Tax=Panagrolaimus sp. JU765 TaxID=591449 RepID=A0AC34RDE5_9BILA
MIGKESLLGFVQTFKMVEKIRFRSHVELNFGEDFMGYKGSQALLVKLIQFAVPYVKYIEFNFIADEWCNVVFDILSKESKQKKLAIDRLPVVNDIAKTALTNMVEKGVLIVFKNITLFVVFQLPACNFESLTVEQNCALEWRFLKYVKCSFRKLNFSLNDFCFINLRRYPANFYVDSVEEIYSTMRSYFECTLKFFNGIKRIFPNVNTSKIDLVPFRQVPESYVVRTKEAICQAPQENIHILLQIYPARDETRLIEFFDGQKIDENIIEWKMESNEKKTFKLQIPEKKTLVF